LFLFFKKESAFFFEKKKQKTFDYKDCHAATWVLGIAYA